LPSSNIISFDRRKRLLKKARRYVASVETFLEDTPKAVATLIDALPIADDPLKQDIILLLGSHAKEEVADPLYELMIDSRQSEEIRHAASVQLSVTCSFLADPTALVDRLLNELNSSDAQRRRNAAFALGWEGNDRAAVALIECLFDPDTDVQQTAVNALSNLRDDRVLDLMLDRLAHGPLEQRRAVLFNLWRFTSQQERVRSVYMSYLAHPDDGLRFDALVLLGRVGDPADLVEVHLRMLADADARIRRLAVERLQRFPGPGTAEVDDRVRERLRDTDARVRQAAVRFFGIEK
jgi:HEAT repeat protein